MIAHEAYGEGTDIVMIHTGGLQGWEGMKYRFGDRFDFDSLF